MHADQGVALLDGHLRPEVCNGERDGLAKEAVAGVAHQPHSSIGAARDGGLVLALGSM